MPAVHALPEYDMPMPEAITCPGEADLAAQFDQLRFLETQRMALIVREWFARHPGWTAPFRFKVKLLPSDDVCIVLDQDYQLAGVVTPGVDSDRRHFVDLSLHLGASVNLANVARARSLATHLGAVECRRADIDAALAEFLTAELQIDGAAYLRGVDSAPTAPLDPGAPSRYYPPAMPPLPSGASLPASLHSSEQCDLGQARRRLETLLAQDVTLQARDWVQRHAAQAPSLRVLREAVAQIVLVRHQGPSAPWSAPERLVADQLQVLLNQIMPGVHGLAANYVDSLVDKLGKCAWDPLEFDGCALRAMKHALDVNGEGWLESVHAVHAAQTRAALDQQIALPLSPSAPRL